MSETTEVRDKLRNTPAVTAVVGTYEGAPAIFGRPVAPDGYDEDIITMYLSVPTQGGLEYGNFGITVNNYSNDYARAQNMQKVVFDTLNRRSGDNDAFFLCSKLPIIPSGSTGDDYNAPVEVLVRRR